MRGRRRAGDWRRLEITSLFPFRAPRHKYCNCVLNQIGELARIEKRAFAGRTFLVVDFRLLWIDPAQHPAAASRATIAINQVCFFPCQWITGIDRCRCVFAEQSAFFTDIEPDPFAILAAINFDAFELNGLHVGFAFRTIHSDISKHQPNVAAVLQYLFWQGALIAEDSRHENTALED